MEGANRTEDASSGHAEAPGDAPGESEPRWAYRTFPALRHDAFRWFLTGHAVSVIGVAMAEAAMGWHVQEITGSPYYLGVRGAAFSLPVLAFSLIGGIVADRMSKRHLLILSQSISMVISLVFAAMVFRGEASFPVVLVCSALAGTVLAFDVPARQAFAIEMVGRKDLLSAIALNSAVFNLGRMVGPLLAGLLIASLGVAACFLIDGLSYLGVLLALIAMRPPPPPESSLPDHHRPWEGIRIMASDPRLAGMAGVLALMLVSGGAYQVLLPNFAKATFGLGPAGFSGLLAASGSGALLGALLVAATQRPNARAPLMVAGLFSMAGGLTFAGLSPHPALAGVGLFFCGAGFVVFLASSNSLVQLTVDHRIRGRVVSVWLLIFGLCMPTGQYATGWIADHVGVSNTYVLEGLCCGGAGAWMTLIHRRRPFVVDDS